MSSNDIDAIRRLTDAATDGPWNADPRDGLVWAGRLGDPVSGSTEPADAEFIAAARTHVPALCDEIEQLRAALDAMRPVVEQAKRVTATWRFHSCIPTADLELTIGEEERKLAEAVDNLPAEIAPNGCDDCSVEPGERHRYFRCPGNGKALLRAEVAR